METRGARVSRQREREAAAKAAEILARHSGGRVRHDGEFVDGANAEGYGSGKLTRAQRRSQERHIPLTSAPQTAREKIARKLWG